MTPDTLTLTLTCIWCHDTTITVRPGEEPHDAADRMKWYDGSVCPSCTPAARAADGADDWVSEGRP